MLFHFVAKKFRVAPWLKAAGVLFSTIVGAGVLGLPFIVARVGVVVGFLYIIAMGLLMCGIHLILAEIVIRTRRHFQLSGLMRLYLGRWAAILMAIIFLGLHFGAMTAYLIGEGESLAAIFGGQPLAWSVIFFIIGSLIIMRGVRAIARFDWWISLLTIGVVALIVFLSAPHATQWTYFPAEFSSLLLPYGVLLFAFHGTSALPELEMIVGTDAHALRKAVIVGSLVPIALYALFAVTVVAVTGVSTSEIATIELGRVVGPRMILIGNIFAIVAMSSSFVTIGQALRRSFQWDYGVSPRIAFALAVGVPLVVYLAGAREFVRVIGFVGATCGTIEIILLLWAYEKNRHSRRRIRGN
ncbi:MAG: hypothetical protein A2848_01670 [Candidatus Magasanikbacteria bacterium RIFCSPHIGHO2_01_FULL_50_8]|uniref:Amino acid transporter transmembrane domain-containing protein n=2 Tax=Candidatus Magasanikiibacteriota TaxID=1752731 RepID=A0A1F6LQZ4_9BACT|nr:MAG: hypothetical protein A2848_01670 [Candidatus Magasanikbacteria bacterium RIFCSPHIGHO2_01_FULL_50_8]OGH67606.1 MAG: hypothetical protein A3C15_01485 [Candidatus Magasanikbacteria bacterium RIFCSPHIGHO2_02_FULL_50_9b]